MTRNGEVIAFDLATRQERSIGIAIGRPGPSNAFRVSHDGESIAILRDGVLEVIRFADQHRQMIDTGVTSDWAWAPDGTALVFVKGGSGRGMYHRYEICSRRSEVWIADLTDGNIAKLGDGCYPAWSPDSQRIAYVSFADQDHPENALLLVNRQGRNRWVALHGIIDQGFPEPRQSFFAPFWSTDGQHIFVLARFIDFWVESTLSTIEQVDLARGTTRPIGVVYDVIPNYVRPSADRTRIAYSSGNEIGIALYTTYTLTGTPRMEKAYWSSTGHVVVEGRQAASIPQVYDGAWSPDSSVLGAIVCQNGRSVSSACPFDSNQGEVRLVDPVTEVLSTPLIRDIDLSGTIEWIP